MAIANPADGLMLDVRHAWRLYRRTPGASLIASAVLAIGLAFVFSFLSLYVDLVLRPHPGFENSGGIVTVSLTDGSRYRGVPSSIVPRIADTATSLEGAVGFSTLPVEHAATREELVAELTTRGFFDVLRPRLSLGRGFASEAHGAEAELVAVISHRFWRDAFGGDPAVIGTTMAIATQGQVSFDPRTGERRAPENKVNDFRIVGVMAPEMSGIAADTVQVWLPYERLFPIIYGTSASMASFTTLVPTLGRRRAGASTRVIAQEVESRYESDLEQLRATGMRLDAADGVVADLGVQRSTARQLRIFLGVSVLLAIVAAGNVSLFLLARAPGRRRELAIRMSVGAPVKRLARQLSREAGLLIAISGMIGLALSIGLGEYLRNLAFLRQADWGNVTLLDWRVLTFTALFLLLLTVLVASAPIVGLKRHGIGAVSRQTAARATPMQGIAGTVQLAIAGALAGAAIAFAIDFGSMAFGDPGYAVEDRYAATYSVTGNEVDGHVENGVERLLVEIERRRERLKGVPAIANVGFGYFTPGAGAIENVRRIQHPLVPGEQFEFRIAWIDHEYVEVLEFRLLHGRQATQADVDVAFVNQTFAREYFGREDVVGEILPVQVGTGSASEIIGVLADLAFEHPAADVPPVAFVAGNPALVRRGEAIIETKLGAVELQQVLESLTAAGPLEMNFTGVVSLAELRRRTLAPDRARGLLIVAAAALVVVLAGLGFYGTQRYLVMSGRREYAIRSSLGAGPRGLGLLVFARGLRMSIPGIVFGIVLAFTATAWLRGEFVSREISPLTVAVLVAVGLVALLLGASVGPARQARIAHPAPLLRED